MAEKQATVAVHGGEHENHPCNSIVPPIFHTAIYSMERFDDLRRYALGQASDLYLYARSGNPTVEVAAAKIAELEGAEAAVVTASGTAAAFVAAIGLLEAGDEIISMHSVYGGTYRMWRDILPRLGIRTRFLEDDRLEGMQALVNDRTRLLWIESPTNPLNRVVDLDLASRLAAEHGLLSLIDNTLASPVNQQPISRGIDLAMHSATKYLSGHSDIVAGTVCGRRELLDKIRKTLVATGGILDPGAAALLIRGIKTLDVRVARVNDSAMRLAEFFESHDAVRTVHYAGLRSSPYFEVAAKQMTGFGGIVSFDLEAGTEEAVERFCDRLELIKISTSLGGTETVVTYPPYTSHVGFSRQELSRSGVGPATLRLSVGLEDVDDLIEDVTRALGAV